MADLIRAALVDLIEKSVKGVDVTLNKEAFGF